MSTPHREQTRVFIFRIINFGRLITTGTRCLCTVTCVRIVYSVYSITPCNIIQYNIFNIIRQGFVCGNAIESIVVRILRDDGISLRRRRRSYDSRFINSIRVWRIRGVLWCSTNEILLETNNNNNISYSVWFHPMSCPETLESHSIVRISVYYIYLVYIVIIIFKQI